MTRRRTSPAACTLVLVLATLAPHSATTAFSINGLFTSNSDDKTAATATTSAVDSDATSLFSFSSQKLSQLLTCVWRGSFERESGDSGASAYAIELTEALDGEESVRTYPTYPHAPVLVGAATCERVVLRWKSFDDAAWPVHKFVLQRFPDLQHRRAWTTLLETDDSSSSRPLVDSFPDAHVRAGQLYSYRVQAISTANVSSAYAVHQVAVAATACSSSNLLSGLLPSWQLLSNWSCEAVRTLALLVVCFLSVYALMRAYGKRVQGPRSRSHRLQRIRKSASETTRSAGPLAAAGGAAAVAKLPLRSSSESSSTSPPSEPLDSLTSQRSIESRSSVGTRVSFDYPAATSTGDARASFVSHASNEKASACQNCQKRFGIFRRRHPCDICHAVTLCRRCGYQAPAGFTRSSVSAMDEVLGASDRRSLGAVSGVVGRESIAANAAASESHRDVKIKTICRSCCEDVYRYSTAVRPRRVHRR